MVRFARFILAALVLTTVVSAGNVTAQSVRNPEDFLGFGVGDDFKLARWETIVSYFNHVAEYSGRVNVHNMGETTFGRPFIYAEISDTAAMRDIGSHRADQHKVADPRLIADSAEEGRLVEDSKVVVLINCNLHSTEIASSQMALELLYDLATGETPEILDILDRTIVILVPSANPDGLETVIDWYERSFGKPWEGSGMPWLYHTYAGHDDNRDWFMLNLKETQLETKLIYEEWLPTVVYDIHQMGSRSARFFVPPFFDPKNPNIHPLTDDMLMLIGGHMAAELTRGGKRGILHAAMYDNWWQGGFRTTVYRHNMVGLLTEAASVRIASPLFQDKDSLRGGSRGMPDYTIRTNHPDPWPGGWWRLRDIVEYEKIACMSLFTLAARYHDLFQSNYIALGRDAIEKGESEPPFAWIIPPGQHDPGTAVDMLERLHATGIEIHRARESFVADGVTYPAGTFIMYCAQPYRAHLNDMMERQVYPDRVLYPGGPPESPYDIAGWTLSLQMGVKSIAVSGPFTCEAVKLDEMPKPESSVAGGGSLIIPAGRNDNFRFLNRLHKAGIKASVITDGAAWGKKTGTAVPSGSIIVQDGGAVRSKRGELLAGLTLDLKSSGRENSLLTSAPTPSLGLYQPWVPAADEGWTRLVFDNFEFDYAIIHNAEILAGGLANRYDCIVIPSVGTGTILNGFDVDDTEPQYAGGIGPDGIIRLQEFVRAGGTLVCIDGSCNLPIRYFNIPVKNVLAGVGNKDFYCPGSILRVEVDTNHPVGYGMSEWVSGYFARSQAFEIIEPEKKDDERSPASRYTTKVVARYSDTVLLESGWIRGEELIKDKPAIVEVGYGDGKIILLGFRAQYRGQSHGTFRLLFNAIQSSTLR